LEPLVKRLVRLRLALKHEPSPIGR
jgi:hypothetical protein